MKKQCFRCGLEKDIRYFYRHRQMGDRHLGKCKECTKLDVKLNYKNNPRPKIYDLLRYRNNLNNRLFVHKYKCMLNRISGKSKSSKSLGKDILDKEEFIKWCESSEVKDSFNKLYEGWKDSGFIRKLSPSIDRINNNLGYIIGNMQWITQQENSRKHNK